MNLLDIMQEANGQIPIKGGHGCNGKRDDVHEKVNN